MSSMFRVTSYTTTGPGVAASAVTTGQPFFSRRSERLGLFGSATATTVAVRGRCVRQVISPRTSSSPVAMRIN